MHHGRVLTFKKLLLCALHHRIKFLFTTPRHNLLKRPISKKNFKLDVTKNTDYAIFSLEYNLQTSTFFY